ncbi:MAG: hemerythrin family protein [Pseudomonadota bacterium]
MLNWDEASHPLGVAEMDATHREFTALVNLLADSDDADFAALFERLLEHCRKHFTSEGRLMRISRFPALGEHEAEHHRIYGDLVQMQRAVQRGRLALPRAFVRNGLAEWFPLHLGSMDAALAAHLKKVGEAPALSGNALPVLG